MIDTAIYIQRNADGQFVGQVGSLTYGFRPKLEKAKPEQIFGSLNELITAQKDIAAETDYGFRLCLDTLVEFADIQLAPWQEIMLENLLTDTPTNYHIAVPRREHL